jgi:hypothetical protein
VVFATQSLADIERSTIAPALIESCPTRIFLPNDRALEPQAKGVHERFGLNARQIEILSTAAPKRDYYAQTARGNRLFELGLGPVALALCGASTPDDHRLIDRALVAGERQSFGYGTRQVSNRLAPSIGPWTSGARVALSVVSMRSSARLHPRPTNHLGGSCRSQRTRSDLLTRIGRDQQAAKPRPRGAILGPIDISGPMRNRFGFITLESTDSECSALRSDTNSMTARSRPTAEAMKRLHARARRIRGGMTTN